jgi:hypothetical protein
VKKGLKYLAKGDYPAARTAFDKHQSHRVYAPLAHFGRIQVGYKTQHQPSLDSLYQWAKNLYRCKEQWQNLPEKGRKKLLKKFRFDTTQIQQLRIDFENQALAQLHDSSGILIFEKHLGHFPDTPNVFVFQRREELRKRMVTWHLKSLRQANYALLDALYKRHQDLLKLRGSRYPNYVYTFILDAFLKEHTYRNIYQFIQEQPEHWLSEVCWSSEAAEVLRRDSIPLALAFLRKYPYFVLDEWLDLHINRLSSNGLLLDSLDYRPSEWQQLAELRLGWDLNKQLLSGKRSPTYDADLLRYLQLTAPSKRGYDIFRMALSAYQRRALWDKAIALLQLAQKLYPDLIPPGCDKSYPFYIAKEEWFSIAFDLFKRPADGISTELLSALSQADRAEYSPVFGPDGQSLYLALEHAQSGLDIFSTHYNPQQGQWSTPQRVDILCTAQDDVPYSITRDGREFLLAQGGKLMFSTFGANDWQKPFGLPLTVNEFPWVGRATLSPDGRCLVFEGSGNKKQAHEREPPQIHLYHMYKGESRFGWSNPQMIVDLFLNGGEERYPCFGPDGNLYFIGDRWPSLGQGDVFVAKPLNAEYKEWSTPQNLGKEINTLGDEKHHLSIAPDNSAAIFSSAELSRNDETELYRIALPSISKAEKRKILTLELGNIGQNLDAFKRREMLLQIKDLETGLVLAEVKPQGERRFIASLPAMLSKVSYQVLESSKNPQPLSLLGTYTLGEGTLQALPLLQR